MKKYALPKDYLSASQIKMYLRCSKQYEYRYVKGLVMPPALPMLQGSAVHKGFEIYYQEVIDGRQPLNAEQLADFTVTQLEDMADEQDVTLEGSSKDQAAAELVGVVKPYISAIAPTVRPHLVEQEVRYETKCGVELLAYIDLVRKPSEWETTNNLLSNRIVDYKITGRKWSLNKLANDLQFLIYSAATGMEDIEIHNLTKTTKKVAIKEQKEEDYLANTQDVATNLRVLRNKMSSASDTAHVENLVESVASAISAGTFIPCDTESWCCNEKFCGFWHLCRGKRQ